MPLWESRPPKFMTKRVLALIVVGVGLAIGGMAVFRMELPHWVDEAALKTQTETGLQNMLGVHVKIKRLTLVPTFFHGFQVRLDDNSLSDNQHHELAHIAQATIQIRYWPLMTQQLPEMEKIRLNHVLIPVDSYNLFKALRLKWVPPKQNGPFKPAKMVDGDVLVSDYRVTDQYVDPAFHQLFPSMQTFYIQGKTMNIRHLISNKPVSIEAVGSIGGDPAVSLNDSKDQSRHRSLWNRLLGFLKGPQTSPYFLGECRLRLVMEPFPGIGPTPPPFLIDPGSHLKFDILQGNHAQVAPKGVRSLNLTVQGPMAALKADYQRKSNQPLALGNMQIQSLDFAKVQALTLEVKDLLPLPIPPVVNQLALQGQIQGKSQFQLDFNKKSTPTLLQSLDGQIQLSHISLASISPHHPPVDWFKDLNGILILEGQTLKIKELGFMVHRIPLKLNGDIHWDRQAMNLEIFAKHLRLGDMELPLPLRDKNNKPLKSDSLDGILDLSLKVNGNLPTPCYQGLLSLQKAHFQDLNAGIILPHIEGKMTFQGSLPPSQSPPAWGRSSQSFKKSPSGQPIAVPGDENHFQRRKNRLETTINFNQRGIKLPPPSGGRLGGGNGYSTPMSAQAQFQISDAQYINPQTHIRIHGIQGEIQGEMAATQPAVNKKTNNQTLASTQTLRLNHFQGIMDGATWTANGILHPNLKAIQASPYQINLKGAIQNPELFKDNVLAKLPQSQQWLPYFKQLQGQANMDATFENSPSGLQIHGGLQGQSLAFSPMVGEDPVRIPSLSVQWVNQQFILSETQLLTGPAVIQISGKIQGLKIQGQSVQPQNPPAYQFHIVSNDIPLSFLKSEVSTLPSTTLLAPMRSFIWNTVGTVQVRGEISQGEPQDLKSFSFIQGGVKSPPPLRERERVGGKYQLLNDINAMPLYSAWSVTFHNAGLSWRGGDFPLYNLNGTLLYRSNQNGPIISSQNLAFRYGNSPIQLQILENGTGDNGFTASLDGILSPLLVNHLLVSHQSEATPYREVPFHLALTGTYPPNPTISSISSPGSVPSSVSVSVSKSSKKLRMPDLTAKLYLDLNPNLSSLDHDASYHSESAADTASIIATLKLHHQHLQLEEGLLHLFDAGDFRATGDIHKLFQPERRLVSVSLDAPEIDLKRLAAHDPNNRFFNSASGSIQTHIKFSSSPTQQQFTNSSLTFNQVAVPYLTLRNVTGTIRMNGESGQIAVDRFEIPGVIAQMTGQTEHLFEVPLTLENVNIQGKQLSVASLNDFSNHIVRPIIVDQLAHSFFRPWQQGDPTSPIQFRDANLSFDNVIYQNILMHQLHSQFSLFANSFFELKNATLQAAGGNANGYLSMSPNEDNFLTLALNVEKVKADAMTWALLGVSNQLFGDVYGIVNFTTFGDTDVEMQKNANGTVHMQINNGRLPAIAKVETLLTTANIFRGGILGLNLNNLFRSLEFYDTNYFAQLSGDMLIANQVLYTQNLKSMGVNLDLLIQGTVKMDDGNANLLVHGRMKQNVASRLGPVGQLSVGEVLHWIPGVGTFGKTDSGLLGYIPGLGFVPGFGGPAQDVNRFQVRLIGQVDEPSAIRDFHWVHKKGTTDKNKSIKK